MGYTIARVPVTVLDHGRGLPLPGYATEGAAGMDLYAAEAGRIMAGGWKRVPTGISLQIPYGLEGQIRPRSGLAFRHGVTVLNSPGTIDSDYTGELIVLLINHHLRMPWTYARGDRIAQLVIAPIARTTLEEVRELEMTERGSGGFGSTGV